MPLSAIFVELGQELEPANAESRLERWYWSGVFGEMYAIQHVATIAELENQSESRLERWYWSGVFGEIWCAVNMLGIWQKCPNTSGTGLNPL